MSTYHDAPFTIEPESVIPVDAVPALGVDEYGHRDEIQQFSEDWAPDDKVSLDISSSGPFVVDVTVNPAQPFADPFRIQWGFGDGQPEYGADDLDQHHTYQAPGFYPIRAVVSQAEEPSFTLDASVVILDDGTLG